MSTISYSMANELATSGLSNFRDNVARKLFAKQVAVLSTESVKHHTMSGESRDLLIASLSTDTDKFLSKESNVGILKILKFGKDVPTNTTESMAVLANKYATLESQKRVNSAIALINDKDIGRKDAVALVNTAFESTDLSLELSEEFNSEFDTIKSFEAEDIISSVSNDVKKSIDDTAEKSKVTKKVIDEFKEVNEKIKEEKELTDDDEVGMSNDEGATPEGSDDPDDDTGAGEAEEPEAEEPTEEPEAEGDTEEPEAEEPTEEPEAEGDTGEGEAEGGDDSYVPTDTGVEEGAEPHKVDGAPSTTTSKGDTEVKKGGVNGKTGDIKDNAITVNVNIASNESETFSTTTEMIKSLIPITEAGLVLRKDNGSLSGESMYGIVRSLEAYSRDYNSDISFIETRINALRSVVSKESEEMVEELRSDLFNAVDKNKTLNASFSKMGFNPTSGAIINDDSITFGIVKRINEFLRKNDVDKITAINSEIMRPSNINTLESCLDGLILLGSMESIDQSKVVSVGSLVKSREKLLESITEFAITLPDDRKDRVIRSIVGTRTAFRFKAFDNKDITKKNTARILMNLDPNSVVDMKKEVARVKELIATEFDSGTKYDEVVDSVFLDNRRTTLSTENLFESILVDMTIRDKKGENSLSSENAKILSEVYASHSLTMKRLGLISHSDMDKYVRGVSK